MAVAFNGINRVMTSPDGITWTASAAAENNGWISVTYGNDLFVAVAGDGTNRVMTSPDGITWTAQTAAESNGWQSVTYGNGQFVAVAASGGTNRVMTSPDGITWTAQTAAESNGWQSITYGNGQFVAVASGGTNRVMTSPDGITWTARTAAENNDWLSVTYGNGSFVAVAFNGANRVMVSADGITWSAHAAAENFPWNSVTYGNDQFVAVSQYGTNQVMTSPAGITSSVSISADPGNSISAGTEVTFTATPTSGGLTPIYQWKVNGNPVGTNSPTYMSSTLADGDVVTVEMTSSELCASPAMAVSEGIAMEVAETCPTDGVLWQERTAAEANVWRSVAYGTVAGNGLYVAVSENGTSRVMTSPDGITWTAQTAAENNTWRSVTFGNGLFVAVSSFGNAMTSPDGINWTIQTIPEQFNDWSSVTYGNGLFVAVSSYGNAMTSPDGINWTTQVPASTGDWRSVTYGNGQFVAVASDGTNRVMTSPDGINWTARTAAENNSWRSVTYGNGLFVAVGASGSNPNRIMTSPDGINWTSYFGAVRNAWTAVAYGNGLFVAVAENRADPSVMTSADGINWTGRAEVLMSSFGGITYGNGQFVAVGGSSFDSSLERVLSSRGIAAKVAIVSNEPDNSFIPGTGVTFTATPTNGGSTPVYQWKKNDVNVGTNSATYTDNTLANGDVITVEMLSNDSCVAEKTVLSNPIAVEVIVPDCLPSGVNWTSRAAKGRNIRSITYGNGLYVAVSINADFPNFRTKIVTSPDGINWTPQLTPVDNNWRSVTYGTVGGNGLFVAVSDNDLSSSGRRAMTSPDGIHWTLSVSSNRELNSVAFGNGTFVAVGFSGTNNVVTSPDGINWTASNAATTASWDAVTYGGGLFVAVAGGEDTPVMTSPDGINWTPQTFAAKSDWASVTYGNGRFVAVAANGPHRTMTSTDGINWTVQAGGIESEWRSVAFGDNKFIAVASSGDTRIMSSPDGITWTPQVAPADLELRAITFGAGKFVAMSANGSSQAIISRVSDPIPAAFAVTGGLACGGTPVAIGLEGSETGVNYQLKKDNVDEGSPLSGTGDALDFGLKTAPGIYTVVATSTAGVGCTATMTGNAVVTGTLYVKPAPSGTGDGSSWENASDDLQAMIDQPSACEIWVAAGTYFPERDPFGNANPADPRDKTFYLKDGVAIYGGFAGTETLRTERDPAANVTILSGDIGTPDDPADNCYHVAISVLDGPATVLDGFTVTKGTNDIGFSSTKLVEDYLYYRGSGAGMNIQESAITVNNCILEDNAGFYGGGMYVYMDEVAPIISNCRIINNTANDSKSDGLGMAIESYGAPEISLTNCDFSANTGGEDTGGAVYLYADGNNKIKFTSCTFSDNANAFGGAVYTYTTNGINQIDFTDCTFSGNTSEYGGAVYQDLVTNVDTFSFTNCLFVGNQSTEQGGALYCSDGTSTLTNCTLTGNSTTSTTENSGAIYAPNGLAIVNSILWDNTSAAGGTPHQMDFGNATPNVTYSTVQGAPLFAGTGNINADPLFTDAANGDYTLQGCSPAINAGDNTGVSATDLAGNARIQGGTVDMGAYENVTSSGIITAIDVANASDCDGQNTTCTTDDTFTADVTVTFTSVPASGTLSLSGPTVVGNVPPVDVADIDVIGANSISVSGFNDPNDNGTYVPDGTVGGATRYTNGVCELTFDGAASWSFNRLGFPPITLAVQNFGNAASVPCSGWESSGNGTPTLTGACDGNTNALSYTFTGVTLAADGGDISLTATFSEGCDYTSIQDARAPSCGESVYTLSVVNTSGNSAVASTFTPEADLYNNAPQWSGLAGFFLNIMQRIRWEASNSRWEVVELPSGTVRQFNTTGDTENLPCMGWESNAGPDITLSGGCGPLTSAGALPCAITDIELSNTSDCNDNSTSESTDDYFTSDVTVTFAYAPEFETLVLTDESGNELATKDVDDDLLCTTTWTFEGVQLAADGGDIVLTAKFENRSIKPESAQIEECTFTSASLGTAPNNCSCCEILGQVLYSLDQTQGVKDVTLSVTGGGTGTTLTEADGTYAVRASINNGITITPTKNIGFSNGVDAADVTRIQQHLVGLISLPGPFQRIAADVNLSKSITAADGALIQQVLLGNPVAKNIWNKSWRFVDAGYVFPDVNAPWNFPETVQVDSEEDLESGIDFLGIKLGDVYTKHADPQKRPEPVVLRIQDQLLQAGDSVSVLIAVNGYTDIAAFQYALLFDPETLQFAGVDLPEGGILRNSHFGMYNTAGGELRSVFSDINGQSVAEGALFYTLRFQALKGGMSLQDVIRLDDVELPAVAYNTELEPKPLALVFVEQTSSGSVMVERLDQRLWAVPNPAAGQTALRFTLPKAGDVQLRLLDVQGRLISEHTAFYPQGKHEHVVQLPAPGLYFAEMVTDMRIMVKVVAQ